MQCRSAEDAQKDQTPIPECPELTAPVDNFALVTSGTTGVTSGAPANTVRPTVEEADTVNPEMARGPPHSLGVPHGLVHFVVPAVPYEATFLKPEKLCSSETPYSHSQGTGPKNN